VPLFDFSPFHAILTPMDEYEILLLWDDEAARWIAENDDIPIALESDSLDVLIERVKIAVPELLELNRKNHVNVALNFKMERQTVLV
jgi:EAL domain-containing protein (putative c-di-GMP-specific phosphodiesterase class I)